MPVRRALLVGLLIALSIVGLRLAPARACSCVPASHEQHFATAAVVFDGTATAVEEPTTTTNPSTSSPYVYPGSRTYVFDVSALHKGQASDPARVVTSSQGSLCGAHFDVGTAYRVYADRRDNGELSTGLCSGNTKVSDLPPPASTTTAKPKATSTTSSSSTTTSTTLEPTTTTSTPAATVALRTASDGGGTGAWPYVLGAVMVAGAAGAVFMARRRTAGSGDLA